MPPKFAVWLMISTIVRPLGCLGPRLRAATFLQLRSLDVGREIALARVKA